MKRKTGLTTLLIAGVIFALFSCAEIKEKVDEKRQQLNDKAEKLDSMINVEMSNKKGQLDSLIDRKMEKANTLDSVIEGNPSRLDSLLNN